jgi:hypothetical protein
VATVRIDADGGCEYAVKLSAGATPRDVAASQTWYPDRRLLVGYSAWWSVAVSVDGDVEWVAADGDATVDGGGGYGGGGYGDGSYGGE